MAVSCEPEDWPDPNPPSFYLWQPDVVQVQSPATWTEHGFQSRTEREQMDEQKAKDRKKYLRRGFSIGFGEYS